MEICLCRRPALAVTTITDNKSSQINKNRKASPRYIVYRVDSIVLEKWRILWWSGTPCRTVKYIHQWISILILRNKSSRTRQGRWQTFKESLQWWWTNSSTLLYQWVPTADKTGLKVSMRKSRFRVDSKERYFISRGDNNLSDKPAFEATHIRRTVRFLNIIYEEKNIEKQNSR